MTAWTDERWDLFFDLLDNGWPGELDPDAADAYRVLLDSTEPDHVVAGLQRLLHAGARFRPSAAEILGACRRDPGRPTFAEATRLIFGPRGVLAARPEQRRYSDPGDRAAAYRQAALARAGEMHPLIGTFVRSQGIDRLRELALDDPDYGPLRRKELQAEWDAHVERADERDVAVAALPSGERHRALRRFDPLAALSAAAPVGALPAGTPDPEEVQHGDR